MLGIYNDVITTALKPNQEVLGGELTSNKFEGVISQVLSAAEDKPQDLTKGVRRLFQDINAISYNGPNQKADVLDIAGYQAISTGSGAQLTIPTSKLNIGDGVFQYNMSKSISDAYGQSNTPESITVRDKNAQGGSRLLSRQEIVQLDRFISQNGLDKDPTITIYRDREKQQQEKKRGYEFRK
jgi:hypothetical protein